LKKYNPTEKRILDSARKLFQLSGYRETTMRQIASDAGINMAMLHYYFRSKENLFLIIFNDTFRYTYIDLLKIIANENMDLFTKIRVLVKEYDHFFEKNPHIPNFLIYELIRNPEKIAKKIQKNWEIRNAFQVFNSQVDHEAQKGTIKSIPASFLLIYTISICLIPSLVNPLLIQLSENDKNAFKKAGDELDEYIVQAIRV
jgi:TetR/AcrR family transcriptional regulator